MSDATHAYVGSHPDGPGYCAAIVDVPGEETRTSESVAEFIRNGYAVTRVALDEARRGLSEYAKHKREAVAS